VVDDLLLTVGRIDRIAARAAVRRSRCFAYIKRIRPS
jgi:hypothetical protein